MTSKSQFKIYYETAKVLVNLMYGLFFKFIFLVVRKIIVNFRCHKSIILINVIIRSKISLPSSSSLSDGFDPSKINIEMGGFRPVYNPGTVEYVEHTIR